MARNRIAADRHPGSLKLYRIGALSVPLFLLTGIVLPMVTLNWLDYDAEMAGEPLIAFIGQHRTWWFILQNLTMGSMVFLFPPLIALFPALMHADRAWAAIGVTLALACQILFMAYFPVVNGLGWLADRYVEAADPAYRAALSGGAEALVAQNNAYGPSDTIFAVSVGLIAVAMWRGEFPAWVAIAGFATALIGSGAAFFKPMIGIHYLWWWAALLVWLVGTGLTLWRLGSSRD